MKNYFQKILALFTGNDYPGSTRQEFYKWLVDEEHVSEKDEALQTLWEEGYKSGTAPNLHQSYELLRRNAGIPSVREERRIRPIHIWQIAAAVFFMHFQGFTTDEVTICRFPGDSPAHVGG